MTTNALQQSLRNEAFALIFKQIQIVCFGAVLALCFYSSHSAISFLAGGAAYCLPCLFFVWRVFRYSRATQMVQFMRAFCVGEAIKLILSSFLFLIIVKYLPVSLLSVLAGFAAAIVAFWIACFWQFTQK